MTRKLLASTIVPPTLYVIREADRQLNSSIEEMGRPPYILVARQMGKTNLLINMKRERTDKGDVVVYFDLSARFSDARSFFRNVVDTILDQAPHSSDATAAIAAIRVNAEQPPTEYAKSLRLILNGMATRRLVIVFDEIDSLLSVSYSDAILAQVRSMYFSRINVPEFWRLTYVLSGVVEPSDLIKNRDISPFNIGEKIYLGDFSEEETLEFLRKSELILSAQEIADLYRFTRGNPRMVWDICSEIERELERNANRSSISALVRKLYLTHFDRPPVDHVRTMVEADNSLRGAVSLIRTGRASEIESAVRSRLYLAGITSLDDDGTPFIKNEIIDLTLSEEWLSSVSSTRVAVLEEARRHFRSGNWPGVIAVLESKAVLLDEHPSSRLQLALAFLYEGRTSDAIDHFTAVLETAADPELLASATYHYAVCQQRLGNISGSIETLRGSSFADRATALLSKVALMTALIRTDTKDALAEASSVGKDLIREFSASAAGDEPLRTVAYFNVGVIQAMRQDLRGATVAFENAERFASVRELPAIHNKLAASADSSAKAEILLRSMSNIIDNDLRFSRVVASELDYQPRHLAEILDHLLASNCTEAFTRLLQHSVHVTYGDRLNESSLLIELSTSAEDAAFPNLLSHLWSLLRNGEVSAVGERLAIARLNAEFGDIHLRAKATADFETAAFDTLPHTDEMDEQDILFLLNASAGHLSAGNHERVLKIAAALNDAWPNLSSENIILAAILHTQEMQAALAAKDLLRARKSARRSLEIVKLRDLAGSDYAGFMNNLHSQALRIMQNVHLAPMPVSADPFAKFGRNTMVHVRDKNSNVITSMKFKKAEEKLRSGTYELMPRMPSIPIRRR